MPIYSFECLKCKHVNEFIIGISELPDIAVGDETNLKKISCYCENCKDTKFKKLPSAHGKTPINWSSWNSEKK